MSQPLAHTQAAAPGTGLPAIAAQELLSARQISELIGLTPRAVRLRMGSDAGQLVDGVRKWPVSSLPADYQLQLADQRRRTGAWLVSEAAQHPTWRPGKKLSEYPPASQAKAHKVREVMAHYFDRLDAYEAQGAKAPKTKARQDARQKWLEVFEKSASETTIRNRVRLTEQRGGIDWAPIEAYVDNKAVPHPSARLEKRGKVPPEFIRAYKSQCVQEDQDFRSALRKFEIDWKTGKDVPGLGRAENSHTPFPIKIAQARRFAPSAAVMKQNGRGKFSAKVDGAVSVLRRTTRDLRRCEVYTLDDTRSDVLALDNLTGRPISVTLYLMMDLATRRIESFLMREKGSIKQRDVEALVSRTLRTTGLAPADAPFTTQILFERGSVACSPAREVFINSLFPKRLKIKRTQMVGGQNNPGDFVQSSSGAFWGKGHIESFMRTFRRVCKFIPGQRGSTYQGQPASLGIKGVDRKSGYLAATSGSRADEATRLGQAARAISYLKSLGTENDLPAIQAAQEAELDLPVLFVDQLREAITIAIAFYNQRRGHRMEGFDKIPVPNDRGGFQEVTESPDDRAKRLEWEMEQSGCKPVRLSPADAVTLLHSSKSVTVTPNGAKVEDNWYWHPDSLAVMEAQRLGNLKKEYIAVYDPEGPMDEIFLLKNKKPLEEGDAPVFFERLPRQQEADYNSPASIGQARELHRREQNRLAHELSKAAEPHLKELDQARQRNIQRLGTVTTFMPGTDRDREPESDLGRRIRSESSPKSDKSASDFEQKQAALVDSLIDDDTPATP